MKKFRYSAKTQDSKTVTGTIEASNLGSAVTILRSRNLVVISLREITDSFISNFLKILSHVSTAELVEFTRQLSIMVSAGLPLTDALQSIGEQAKPTFQKIIFEILNDIRGGCPLNEALGRHGKIFPKTYLAIVRSGEASGSLDKVLLKLADSLEKQQGFVSRVKAAMIYPAIVISAMILVGFIMLTFVVPKLLGMFAETKAQLPLPTKILIFVSNIFSRAWWFLLLILAGGGYAFNLWRKTTLGKQVIDKLWLKIPLLGKLNEKIILASLTRTLAMLVGNGVPIIESLNIVSEVSDNVVFNQAIKFSASEVERGVPLSTSIAKYDFFPPIIVKMISVGEETGKLSEVLERVSTRFEEESDLAIKGLTSAIEPLMIIILGLGVAFLVVAIILPIYNLTEQF